MIDYVINPVLMGGLVKERAGGMVKIHLHGRLGVIVVPERLIVGERDIEPGDEARFYFSYLQVVENPYDYDSSAMRSGAEMIPSLLGGELIEVNDTAVKAQVMDGLGSVSVPRRWVFTDVKLELGQNVEFYFSPVQIVERSLPVSSQV